MSARHSISLIISSTSFLPRAAPRCCQYLARQGDRTPTRIPSAIAFWRTFATHTERPFDRSSGSSSSRSSKSNAAADSAQAEDLLHRLESQARRTGRTGFEGQESVGPFPLGVGPSGRATGWARWRDLGLGGKLVRATRQTGNLSVIIIGGGLFVILAFALSTELFAKNSPSVLYSKAVDLIRESDAADFQLNPHLLPPLSFTHTPHASAPIRGSPPLPTRHVQHPASGREHLLLTFWVHGRGIGEEEPLGWARRWYTTVLGWGREAGEWAGLVQTTSPQAVAVPSTGAIGGGDAAKRKAETEGGSWFGGVFGGLSGLRGGEVKSVTRGLPPPGTYKVGEVHGDYVKNAAGHYQLLSLVIDIPSSRAAHPGRAVVFWSPEADTEGILGRRR